MERLTNLADILRSANCVVEELPNWKTTSRNNDQSVYLPGRPTHFMHHHTAHVFHPTPALPHRDHTRCRAEANALQLAEPNEPTSNLALCPHSVWFCVCAGPSNTNGLGSDWWHPVGDPKRVPDNSMNSYAIANEMMNNGVGEAYPVGMLDSMIRGTAAICRAFSIGVFENRAHFEWAPTRKIDPAGPCRYMGTNTPNMKWNMGLVRSDLQAALNPTPAPTPGGDMDFFANSGDNTPVYAIFESNGYRTYVPSVESWLYMQDRNNKAGHSERNKLLVLDKHQMASYGPVLGPDA